MRMSLAAVGPVDVDGQQVRQRLAQPLVQLRFASSHFRKWQRLKQRPTFWRSTFLTRRNGVCDPLDVTGLVRIKRHAEAGPLGHVGDFADHRHGPIVEGVRRRLSARDGNPNLGVAAVELLDGRFQAGGIGGLGRIEAASST